jgi:hypothetical protein
MIRIPVITKDKEKARSAFWMSPETNNRNYGIDDDISKSSDVFQLISIFWLIVNKVHATGVLRKADHKQYPPTFD